MDLDVPPRLRLPPVDFGAYRELSAMERATSVRKAQWMLTFERQNVFRVGLHSSPGHFAERNGASAEIGRTELDLGHAMEHYAGLEELVLEGRISVGSAAVLGRMATHHLEREGDDLLEQAQRLSTRQLHRLYVQRRDEKLAGEAIYTVISRLTALQVDDLTRCRTLVSRMLKRPVSTGVTIGVAMAEFRRRHDPLRRRPGRRRMPDTTGARGRHVPAEVDREVRARTDDGCRLPVCDNEIWVDRAHGRPHRRGGSREASNLHLLCRRHHAQFDAGAFLIGGTPDKPLFMTPDGRPIDGRAVHAVGDDSVVAERERRAVTRLVSRTRRAPGPKGARAAPPEFDESPRSSPGSSDGAGVATTGPPRTNPSRDGTSGASPPWGRAGP